MCGGDLTLDSQRPAGLQLTRSKAVVWCKSCSAQNGKRDVVCKSCEAPLHGDVFLNKSDDVWAGWNNSPDSILRLQPGPLSLGIGGGLLAPPTFTEPSVGG